MSQPVRMLARPSLSVEVAGHIREMIVSGELETGARVSEKDLTQRFGVSRTPLREALKVLASEGFVELVPNRGARVSRVTRAEIEDGFPVLGALEGLAGELACRLATDRDIARIVDLTARMRRRYDERQLQDYFRLNQKIHAAIIDAARSPTLAQSHRALAQRLFAARYAANIAPERWAAAMHEHEEIAAQLQARDAAQLGVTLRRHIENKIAVADLPKDEGAL